MLKLSLITKVSSSIIPSPIFRFCRSEFQYDTFYLKSAEAEAHRLIDNFQGSQKSHVLDVGCEQGRLPIGILRVIGEIDYTGINIDRDSIDWCQRFIGEEHPSFKFMYLDLYNERYNSSVIKLDDSFRFNLAPKSIDIVYLFSVFSHTTEEDMRIYLKEFLRILDDQGNLFFTTFVEKNVPDVSINPENYHIKCTGSLHIVRYNKDYLFSLLETFGYSILKFEHSNETDCQSALYLSKRKD